MVDLHPCLHFFPLFIFYIEGTSQKQALAPYCGGSQPSRRRSQKKQLAPNVKFPRSNGDILTLVSSNDSDHAARAVISKSRQRGQHRHSPCSCASGRTALNIWTLLIKSYLNSVLLSLTDSKVIKLLKGVAGKIVVSRLKRERLIKWPLLLLTSSKSAFFYPRQASVRECGFFLLHTARDVWAHGIFFFTSPPVLRVKKKKTVHLRKRFFISLTMPIQNCGLYLWTLKRGIKETKALR